MNITNVRVRIVQKPDTKLKGVATITIDDSFAVHDIKILESEEGYFISMPSKKSPDGEYRDIAHPINSETRKLVADAVLAEFNKVLAETPVEA